MSAATMCRRSRGVHQFDRVLACSAFGALRTRSRLCGRGDRAADRERHATRRRRDFAAADRIRNDLAAPVCFSKTARGTRWNESRRQKAKAKVKFRSLFDFPFPFPFCFSLYEFLTSDAAA